MTEHPILISIHGEGVRRRERGEREGEEEGEREGARLKKSQVAKLGL